MRTISFLSAGIPIGVVVAVCGIEGRVTQAEVAPPTHIATSLKSFEGKEEPTTKYVVATDRFEPDDYVNMTDVGDNTVRMTLRYRKGEWWDADRATQNKDRQRAEVKGLGPHQKDGETFEYGTIWRTDPDYVSGNRFCHVYQLKATDGDNGAPLVVLSILAEKNTAAVRYWPGNSRNFIVARKFAWKPGEWQTVKIRIKVSKEGKGEVTASVNGDAFQGATNVPVYRPDATDYRPKWGLYRGVTKDMPYGDNWVEHKNASARKL